MIAKAYYGQSYYSNNTHHKPIYHHYRCYLCCLLHTCNIKKWEQMVDRKAVFTIQRVEKVLDYYLKSDVSVYMLFTMFRFYWYINFFMFTNIHIHTYSEMRRIYPELLLNIGNWRCLYDTYMAAYNTLVCSRCVIDLKYGNDDVDCMTCA